MKRFILFLVLAVFLAAMSLAGVHEVLRLSGVDTLTITDSVRGEGIFAPRINILKTQGSVIESYDNMMMQVIISELGASGDGDGTGIDDSIGTTDTAWVIMRTSDNYYYEELSRDSCLPPCTTYSTYRLNPDSAKYGLIGPDIYIKWTFADSAGGGATAGTTMIATYTWTIKLFTDDWDN